MSNTHELKTWPEFFEHVASGAKSFEVRNDDRGFRVGDVLRLREYDPDSDRYTGLECVRRVTFVLKGGCFGIASGFVVLGLDQDAAEARGFERARKMAEENAALECEARGEEWLGSVIAARIRAMQYERGEGKCPACEHKHHAGTVCGDGLTCLCVRGS